MTLSRINQAVIEAYNRGYRVSEIGRVLNPLGVQLSTYVNSTKYLEFSIKFDGRIRSIPVHKLQAYQKFGDELFNAGTLVRHLNGIREDNSMDNISIGSVKDNQLDRPKDERLFYSLKASRVNRKLTFEEAEMVRKEVKLGTSQVSLAKRFGVTKATISNIVNNKCYKHE